jgi:TatD DNase family protein
MFLVDSHCHLDMKEFANDLDQVVANAHANGIKYLQTICTRLDNFPNVLKVAEKFDNIFCSVGVHPNEVEEVGVPTVEELLALSQNPKVIGLGETGLDYYYENSKKELQIEAFRNHITVSRQTGLPVIIHSRSADNDTINILREEQAKGKFPALIHCFTSTKELADVALELDMHISISGIITFKNAIDLQNIVLDFPLSNILVETDAPYLAPTPHRGKRCEPAFTKNTAEFLANLKGVSFEEVASVTTNNFKKLFSKARIES